MINTYNSFTVDEISLGLGSVTNMTPYSKSRRHKKQDQRSKSFSSILKKAEEKRADARPADKGNLGTA